MMIRISLILIAGLFAGGCTSSNLTSAITSFDTSVAKAVEMHNAQLDKVVKLHGDELRDQLAGSRALLATTGGCDVLLIAYEPELAADCAVVRINEDGETPVDAAPVNVARLQALARSLAGYSSSLKLLFADAAEDRKRFGTAVGGLATAIGGLQGQIERIGGAQGANPKALGAVAALVAEAGALRFEYQRSRALRRIIRESHPLVVAATGILGQSSGSARTAILARTVSKDLDDAKRKLRQLVLGQASISQIRKAQDRLFTAHRDYLAAASVISSFGQIRAAHAAMVKAANEGMSSADLAALAAQLVALAGRVDEAVETLQEEL